MILSVGGRQPIIMSWQTARVERVCDPPWRDIRTFFSEIATGITKDLVVIRSHREETALPANLNGSRPIRSARV